MCCVCVREREKYRESSRAREIERDTKREGLRKERERVCIHYV